jgi:hypothetical protein
LFAEPVVNLIGWPLMHKPKDIKFSAVSTLDMPSLVDESASQASRNISLSATAARMVTMARKRCHVL